MRIIGISAKKQGGKDTAGKYITGRVLFKAGNIEGFEVTKQGELSVLTTDQNGVRDWGILDLNRKDPEFIAAAERTIWPWVKIYSFADPLKRLGINLFGLTYEQVYGNEEQRAAPTHLLWENMPGVVTYEALEKEWGGMLCCWFPNEDEYGKEEMSKALASINLIYHPKGAMSGREWLQFFGTEIGRKMYPNIWINATISQILNEEPEFALITDVRFPDEVKAIKDAGGEVIRLCRNQDVEDGHESENALNSERFDWGQFDHVIDNRNLSIDSACKTICKALMI